MAYAKPQIVKGALAAVRAHNKTKPKAKAKPSAGMSKAMKADMVKDAKSGMDMGDKGKNFSKIADQAADKYGSKTAGNKVAGAIFWKKMKGRG